MKKMDGHTFLLASNRYNEREREEDEQTVFVDGGAGSMVPSD